MAKVQQKTSLCKEIKLCTCKYSKELKCLKRVIYGAADYCKLTFSTKEKDNPFLLIMKLRNRIERNESIIKELKEIVISYSKVSDSFCDSSNFWYDRYKDAEILRKIAESKFTDKNKTEAPTECKVRHLRVV